MIVLVTVDVVLALCVEVAELLVDEVVVRVVDVVSVLTVKEVVVVVDMLVVVLVVGVIVVFVATVIATLLIITLLDDAFDMMPTEKIHSMIYLRFYYRLFNFQSNPCGIQIYNTINFLGAGVGG